METTGDVMTLLTDLVDAVSTGGVEVIDLTAPLSSKTPVLVLPEPFGQTDRFALHEISHYDDRGPGWYWNNISTGEHTGTHLDAPIHWVTGQDRADVSQLPPAQLVAPAAVVDVSDRVTAEPDFLLGVEDIKTWENEHGGLPESGWLLLRTGWDARSHDQTSSSTPTRRARTRPGSASSALVG
jgi:kynurenine formamidase